MRRAFADTLLKLAQEDPSIIFLTGDLGFGVFDEYQKQFPDRFINVGICEQAMIDIAAGLALEGYRPICYSIASFMTGRAWEQIKVSLCYHKLPVVVVGAGGGYCYSRAGTTHHSAEDLGLISLLPCMTVTTPGCPSEVSALLPQLVELDGPSYMRIGKYGEEEYGIETVNLGRVRFVGSGSSLDVVLTTGDLVHRALEEFPEAWIYQMHTIKPLDTEFLDCISAMNLIVMEEHSPNGGLYAAIVNAGYKASRYGPPDSLQLECVDRDELWSKWLNV